MWNKKAMNHKPGSVDGTARGRLPQPSVLDRPYGRPPGIPPAIYLRLTNGQLAQRRKPLWRRLILLLMRFARPIPLPVSRWALTPPFHPCGKDRGPSSRFVFCCAVCRNTGYLQGVIPNPIRIFRPGVTRHHAPRSPDFPRTALMPPRGGLS